MKKTKALIGLLCMVGFMSFTSCDKEDEDTTDDTSTSSSRSGELDSLSFDEVPGHECKGNKQQRREAFMAKLSEEEKAKMETLKPTLEGIKEKKEAHFESLDEATKTKLKNRALTREEHDAIRASFEATLTAEETEALAYLKTLKEKYKPEGAPARKH